MSDPHTYQIRPLSRDEIEALIFALRAKANDFQSWRAAVHALSPDFQRLEQQESDSRALARELHAVMEETDDTRAPTLEAGLAGAEHGEDR